MKILFSEHNFDEATPGILQASGAEVFIPKEELPDVHTFGREEFLFVLKDVQPDILVVGLKFKIDKEVLDLLKPNNCECHLGKGYAVHCEECKNYCLRKAVFTRTTGLDHIDTAYCEEKGIEIIKLMGEELGDVVAVPELCISQMIQLLRMGKPGYEVRGKTLGIIGLGRIGKILSNYALGLGMKVIYQDKELGYGLEKLLKNSDIVSLNITASEENRNFMNLEKFKLMKDGSWFLNSARPWLVDIEALKWALEKGPLNGAWIDFEMPFIHPNMLVTDHKGGSTFESSIKTEIIIRNKILQYANNNRM